MDRGKGKSAHEACGSSPKTQMEDPLNIKFSQNSISSKFKDGTLVADLEAQLRNGSLQKRDIPMVRVTRQDDGELWAHDHRRLHVLQNLRRSGDCGRVKVELTDQPVPQFKRSTCTGGNSVQVTPLPKNDVVVGWEYSAMPSSEYQYIGKVGGQPMYLTNSPRALAPTFSDLDYMTR